MIADPILPASRVEQTNAKGYWCNQTLLHYVEKNLREKPDDVAITGFNSMTRTRDTVSFRQLSRYSDRIAAGLAKYGVEKGDVVSVQLPNWWQFVAVHFACLKLGAITNPVMPIFRHREVTFMLGFAESKVMILPKEFRGFDHPKMMEEIRPNLPKLKHLFVIGGSGESSFEEVLMNRRWEDETDTEKLFADRALTPNDVVQLIYTSGTTGEPKGVMHTSNTIVSMPRKLMDHVGIKDEQIFLMASPMAHQTGFLIGMIVPAVLGRKVVLQDVWDAEVAYQLIQDEGVTCTMASTPFLADLLSCKARERYRIPAFKTFLSGGAPIPRVHAQQGKELLGADVISIWGMTETGTTTIVPVNAPKEKVYQTDGKTIDGMEVRIVDQKGKPVPPDHEGRLQCRGAFLFVGYLKRPEAYDVDKEGWFETGDLAKMDTEGYIRITGRSKDILIRGGENIPVVEVENVLYKHSDIKAVAIVGMPDERLGERGAAFLETTSGKKYSLEEIRKYLLDAGVAKNYWPERLEYMEALPRTPSGKIQKFKLREMAKTFKVETVKAEA